MELALGKTILAPAASDCSPAVARVSAKDRGAGRFNRRWGVMLLMALVLAVGILLRIYPSAGFTDLGHDEHGYMVFLRQIAVAGVVNYDAVVQVFVENQYARPVAVVPATRIGFLLPAYFARQLFHCGTFQALQFTSSIGSILSLGLVALFAYRAGGRAVMLGVTTLFATAPLQISLSQRALIDGYFAFWAIAAVWLAWENLQRPKHWGWLSAYAATLAMLVLTKENAAFVVFAIFGTLVLSRWLGYGKPTVHLFAATVVGPVVAVLFLAWMVGGLLEWVRFYEMFVEKSRTNPYSIEAQDGPWYRYLIDFSLMSPVVVALALGQIFQLRKANRPEAFLTVFLVISFFVMANVQYGMSLRYAAYWDVALCWLAGSQVLVLSRRFPRVRPPIIAAGLFMILAVVGLIQYDRFFVGGAIYDSTTAEMVHATRLVK